MPKLGSRRSPRKFSDEALAAILSVLVPVVLPTSAPAAARQPLVPYAVEGDAIPRPLTGHPGNADEGRRIVGDRQTGLCLLCHSGPFPEQPLQGDLAPDLGGAGRRWSAGQLRLRLVAPERLSPGTIMPSYYRTQGLVQVSPAFAGKPILTAEQIEDVVAYLSTLRR